MKKNKIIAAILFGVLAIVQYFGVSYFFLGATSQLPTFAIIEFIALAVFVVVCFKMFSTAEVEVTSGEKRGAAALCVIYLAAIAIKMTLVLQIISLAFMEISQELAMNQATSVVYLCVRTALLIGAMYFTIANEKITVAQIEFDGGEEASNLETAQAVEIITEKLDAVEE